MNSWISDLQFSLIQKFYKLDPAQAQEAKRQTLQHFFGADFPSKVKDQVVIDFGCGHGEDTMQLAAWGAKLAIGLEIREELVLANRKRYDLANVQFHTHLPAEFDQKADVVISVDAFEHFDQPETILKLILGTLKPGGEAYISFGPTWLHPYGGHLFSVFPWAHLLLSEKALVKWRNQYFNDGATRFTEVAGGLNKMRINTFEELVHRSGFELVRLHCPPMRNKPWLQKILGREFATGLVQARLRKPL